MFNFTFVFTKVSPAQSLNTHTKPNILRYSIRKPKQNPRWSELDAGNMIMITKFLIYKTI